MGDLSTAFQRPFNGGQGSCELYLIPDPCNKFFFFLLLLLLLLLLLSFFSFFLYYPCKLLSSSGQARLNPLPWLKVVAGEVEEHSALHVLPLHHEPFRAALPHRRSLCVEVAPETTPRFIFKSLGHHSSVMEAFLRGTGSTSPVTTADAQQLAEPRHQLPHPLLVLVRDPSTPQDEGWRYTVTI